MIWLKRLLLFITGASILVIAASSTAVLLMDEDDYKASLVWVAEKLFDSELRIQGELSVRYSNGLLVNIGDVELAANDQSYRFSTDTLTANIRIDPLFSGTLWLDDLDAGNVILKISETDNDSIDWEELELPKIIIAKAIVRDLTIEYQERPPGTLHQLSLQNLQLVDAGDDDSISVQARGTFEGRSVQLSGKLPSVSALLLTGTAKPVEITLKGEHGYIGLKGSIVDPVKGEGLDIQIDLYASHTARLLEILGDDAPELGELHASATLLGDYETPRLDKIDITLTRGENVSINLKGSVDDIFSGEGLNLAISGHSSQPEVASWLIFNQLNELASLQFKGTVYNKADQFYLSDFDASGETRSGFSLTLRGDAEIYRGDHLFLKTDTGLNVRFSAPDTKAVNLFDVAAIPELGPVSGDFVLLISTDELAIHDADVLIGKNTGNTFRVQGSAEQIPLHDDSAVAGLDLSLSLQSKDISSLASKFDYTLPAIGPGKASMRASGNLDSLSLKHVVVQAGKAGGIQLTAKGSVGELSIGQSIKFDNGLFDITATTSNLSNLSVIADRQLPSLGAVNISSTLMLGSSKMIFDDIRVNIGRHDQPTIRLSGKVTSQLQKNVSVNVKYSVAVADLVAAYFDTTPGYLGRLQGSADISDIDGSWGIEKFNLESSQTSLYQVSIHGGFDDLAKSDEVNIKLSLAVDDPAGLGRALGINLSGLSAYREVGHFGSKQDRITYNGNMTIGKTAGSTVIHGHTDREMPYFKGTIHIPALDLTDFGFHLEKEIESEVIAKPDSTGKDYLFSRKILDLSILNVFALNLNVIIDEVESYGKSSIDSVRGAVSLHDGALKIDPLRFIYAGGTLDMHASVLATETPAYTLGVVADDLILGPILSQISDGVSIEGRTNINMEVNSTGKSAHDIASQLSGNINFEIENARVPSALIDFLSVDVFGWVFSKTFASNKYVDLNCVIMQFTAEEGQLSSKLLLADGPNLSIGGRIDLDLGAETIKATLYPKQKKRLFSTITPVELTGPIKSPRVVAIPAQAALQEIGAMALSPTIYLSARLLESIWSKMSTHNDVGEGCVNVDKMTDVAEKAVKKKTPSSYFDDNSVLYD